MAQVSCLFGSVGHIASIVIGILLRVCLLELRSAVATANTSKAGWLCPVPLVEISSSKDGNSVFSVSRDGLAYLRSLTPPLFFVPALGAYRGGKSMLLNRLRGLRAPYVAGFGVGHRDTTNTRGALICGETLNHRGLAGTVVWMDTEGLDSNVISQGNYSEKLSSLVQLLGSVVILNSNPVIRDSFFAELCLTDRRSQLIKERLQEAFSERISGDAVEAAVDAMRPANPTIVWVVSQVVGYTGSIEVKEKVLTRYLPENSTDPCRRQIKAHFPRHLYHEVPRASDDASKWPLLDRLADEELAADYVNSTASLRGRLLEEMGGTSKSFADVEALVEVIESYVGFVNSDAFDPATFITLHEKQQYLSACEVYGRDLASHAGPLPASSRQLETAMRKADRALKEWRERTWPDGFSWDESLVNCTDAKWLELTTRNGRALTGQLDLWFESNGTGYFMHALNETMREMDSRYGESFALVKQEILDRARKRQPGALVRAFTLRGLTLLSGSQKLLALMILSPFWIALWHMVNQNWFWGLLNLGWQPIVAVSGAGLWWLLDFQVLKESSESLDTLMQVLDSACKIPDGMVGFCALALLLLYSKLLCRCCSRQGDAADLRSRTRQVAVRSSCSDLVTTFLMFFFIVAASYQLSVLSQKTDLLLSSQSKLSAQVASLEQLAAACPSQPAAAPRPAPQPVASPAAASAAAAPSPPAPTSAPRAPLGAWTLGNGTLDLMSGRLATIVPAFAPGAQQLHVLRDAFRGRAGFAAAAGVFVLGSVFASWRSALR